MRCLRSLCLVAFASLLLLTTGVRAGPYPTRSIRIVVPYAPGGNSDLIARILAVRLSESLGQSVVVENRPGASGIIGSEVVARAEPDGYTLLLISSGNLTTNPTLFTKLPYDTVRDFSPISNVAYTSYVLSVNPSLQVKSVKELIDLAKASPGSLDAAIPGIGAGGHLALELFTSMSGAEFTQVVYKGAGSGDGRYDRRNYQGHHGRTSHIARKCAGRRYPCTGPKRDAAFATIARCADDGRSRTARV